MSSAPSEKDTLDEPLLPVSRNSIPLLIHDRWSWYSWSHRRLWAVHLAFFLSYSAFLTVIATLHFHNISCNPNDHIYCKYLPDQRDSRYLPWLTLLQLLLEKLLPTMRQLFSKQSYTIILLSESQDRNWTEHGMTCWRVGHWRSLVYFNNLKPLDSYFHVSEQTLQRLNRTTIALNDGSYVAGLGVYHELHCLVCVSSCQTDC